MVGHNVSAPTARTVRDRRHHGVLLSRERLNKNYLDCPIYDLSKRRVHRGVLDSRYKFARDFAPGEHHTPVIWEQLVAHNDLELYGTARDPEEIVNLAARPEVRRDLILPLNAMTNALVAHEVGEDQGGEYPGPDRAIQYADAELAARPTFQNPQRARSSRQRRA